MGEVGQENDREQVGPGTVSHRLKLTHCEARGRERPKEVAYSLGGSKDV